MDADVQERKVTVARPPRVPAPALPYEPDDEPPLYQALGSLAQHLLLCLEAERTERFDAIFAVVERWHVDGDAYVAEAATVGLLESLQNMSGGSDRGRATVERWLGPESKRRWDKLDRFWTGDRQALSSDG